LRFQTSARFLEPPARLFDTHARFLGGRASFLLIKAEQVDFSHKLSKYNKPEKSRKFGVLKNNYKLFHFVNT